MSIQEHLNKIRNAIYGREVRESIAKGIETAYDDASENDNANMEVKIARGTHPNLRSRLEEVDDKQQQTTAQLAQTEKELNDRVSETIANAGDGTLPTEVVDMRTVNGKTYSVAGDALRALSKGVGLENDSVSPTKISSKTSPNMLNKADLVAGFHSGKAGSTGHFNSGSPDWSTLPYAIPVNSGDVVRFNLAFQETYFIGVDDANKVVQVGDKMNSVGEKTITVSEGVTKFYTSVYNIHIGNAMITVNDLMPNEYIPFLREKTLDWLSYKPKSIGITALSDGVVEFINSTSSSGEGGIVSDWIGKTFVSLGDSITWQDDKPYGSTSNVARGYQTIIKENLLFNRHDNYGQNGRSMSGGIAGDTNVIGRTIDYSDVDLVIIAAGTNDFKLNKALGDKGKIGDTQFDTQTFYGAYRSLLEYILTNNPTIRIVLFTPLQRDNTGYDVNFTNTAGHKLIDYVNAIYDVGEMYSVPVCDMYRNSGITKKTLSTFTMDGLHPNDIGYKRMGGYASKFISNIAP